VSLTQFLAVARRDSGEPYSPEEAEDLFDAACRWSGLESTGHQQQDGGAGL
jgi:hypothetical protein